MDKNPRLKIYGLLGYPAKHSLSPLMHNAAFRFLKINAKYKIFEKRPGELGNFLQSLSRAGIYGLNVTVPYKEKVLPFLHKVSASARLIGAVNTIKVEAKKIEGFNTDGEGFLKHLKADLKFNPKGKVIALLGAGGAAKAITVYLSKAKVKSIAIFDIDKCKLIALISHLRASFEGVEFIPANSIGELNIKGADLLINATPIGMKETDPCLVEEKLIHKNLLVYDLIYNPPETRLLKIAREKGALTSNGLGMLLYQGTQAFELWTGRQAPKEVMQEELLRSL